MTQRDDAEGSSRRLFLAGLGAAIATRPASALAAAYCSDIAEDTTAQSRGAIALGDMNTRVAWGVAIEAPAIDDAALTTALAAEAPKFLAIANGLKFGDLYPTQVDIEPHPGIPTGVWTECDGVVALASRLGVPVRGDCLAWDDWMPGWMMELSQHRPDGWSGLMRRYFDRHFEDVFAHFAQLARVGSDTDLRWVGLVNEPFNPWLNRGGVAAWRPGIWLDALGTASDGVPAYIHRAFELGARHRSSKQTSLFVNEAQAENDHFGPLIRPALLGLVDSLQKSGKQVDAVGLECHLMPQWMNDREAPDWRPFVAFLKDLSKRGVRILLTELDVIDCSLRDVGMRDALVARYMSSFVQAALNVPSVEMVTNWDFSDKYSWLRDDAGPSSVYRNLEKWASCVADPPCPRPDIYDQAMRPKSARRALAAALAKAPQ